MRSLLPLLLTLLLAGTACTSTATPMSVAAEAPKATPTPTPTPTPVAPPTPEPIPQAQPFAVQVSQVRVANGNNAALFGGAAPPPDPAVANQTVDAAAAILSRFLNAQFVARDTWFSDAAVATLVDPATIAPEVRAALGVLDPATVLGTVSGSASATADVVIDGATVQAVTLTYASTLEVMLTDAAGPVSHTGVITFSVLQGQLVLAGIQPTTTFGGDLQTVLS